MRTVKSARLRRQRQDGKWAVTFSFRDQGPEQAFLMEHGAVGGMFSAIRGSGGQHARKDEKFARFERDMLYALLAEKTGMTITGLRQVVLARMEDHRETMREDARAA